MTLSQWESRPRCRGPTGRTESAWPTRVHGWSSCMPTSIASMSTTRSRAAFAWTSRFRFASEMRETKLRVLIVDDEPLSRRGVRARLLGHEDMDVVGEAENGLDAVWAIRQLAPDLVFLDVQMPGLDGFGVVEQVGVERMPVVVFLTAFDDHALKAFEVQALDYLLKPIDDERFAVTLQRARRRVAERRAGAGTTLPGLRIAARDRGRVFLLDANEIDWVEADGDYVRIHAGDRGL